MPGRFDIMKMIIKVKSGIKTGLFGMDLDEPQAVAVSRALAQLVKLNFITEKEVKVYEGSISNINEQ